MTSKHSRPPERDRYDALYRLRGYPSGSPEKLMIWAGCDLNARLVDIGCGRATLSRFFPRYTGFDFTLSGIRGDRQPGRFIEAHLTGPQAFTGAAAIMARDYDVAVCNDVMEHVPPEDVTEALENIGKLKVSRLLFSICCRPSKWKDDHGGLHLTIKTPEWWRERLASCIKSEITRAETFGASAFFEIKA